MHLTVTPSMDARTMEVSVPYVQSMAGADLPASDMARLLTRMQLAAEADAAATMLTVHIPVTRSDVLHPCDVVEVCTGRCTQDVHRMYTGCTSAQCEHSFICISNA